MPTLHQYDYIFAVSTIFAFLDAWNIGKNLLLLNCRHGNLTDPRCQRCRQLLRDVGLFQIPHLEAGDGNCLDLRIQR